MIIPTGVWIGRYPDQDMSLLGSADVDWMDKEGRKLSDLYHDDPWVPADELEWSTIVAYRIKPEPVVRAVNIYGWFMGDEHTISPRPSPDDTHRITFAVTDGEPDCSSIKMERINV